MLKMYTKHCILQLYAKNADAKCFQLHMEKRKRFCTDAKTDENISTFTNRTIILLHVHSILELCVQFFMQKVT